MRYAFLVLFVAVAVLAWPLAGTAQQSAIQGFTLPTCTHQACIDDKCLGPVPFNCITAKKYNVYQDEDGHWHIDRDPIVSCFDWPCF